MTGPTPRMTGAPDDAAPDNVAALASCPRPHSFICVVPRGEDGTRAVYSCTICHGEVGEGGFMRYRRGIDLGRRVERRERRAAAGKPVAPSGCRRRPHRYVCVVPRGEDGTRAVYRCTVCGDEVGETAFAWESRGIIDGRRIEREAAP